MKETDEEKRVRVNAALAEQNKVIDLGYTSEPAPEPVKKYYEVISESANGQPLYGNNPRLAVGTVFACTKSLPANLEGITEWLHPTHLEFSGFNLIALECCKEIDLGTYDLKITAQERLNHQK